jgi:hypothetical protein
MNIKARQAGAILQGILIGILVFIALVGFAALQGGGRLFRYEGF